MRAGSVPLGWVGAVGRLDAQFLLALKDEVEARGVDPDDLAAVKAVAEDLRFLERLPQMMRRGRATGRTRKTSVPGSA